MGTNSFRRIVDLQKQLQRAAEWRLHDLRQRRHRLRAEEHEVLQALARDDRLYSGLAPALARRLGRLAAEGNATAAAEDRQTHVVLERNRLLELAERRRRAADGARRRASDESALGELVDLITGSAAARVR